MGNNAPIGVFDSGVGGLTVAREIMRQIPGESIVYFGDTARVPYGNKSEQTVLRYSRQIVKFLLTKKVKAIVIACNTASAFALEALKAENNIPVLGVVNPGAKAAARATKNGSIGVIGTEGTIRSGIYHTFLNDYNSNLKVYGKACPLFVSLVEEGMLEDTITDEITRRYMKELQGYEIDTLVLGCTHYPLIRHTIQRIVGKGVTLVNPAYETAIALKETLKENKIETDSLLPEHRFYVSDGAEKFKKFANTILPCEVEETVDIEIEKY